MLHISIVTSETCEECLAKTLRFIQTQSMPFNIPQQDGSFIIVSVQNPFVNITGVSNKETTIKGDLLLIFHILIRS
jgi:hypothetical protein